MTKLLDDLEAAFDQLRKENGTGKAKKAEKKGGTRSVRGKKGEPGIQGAAGQGPVHGGRRTAPLEKAGGVRPPKKSHVAAGALPRAVERQQPITTAIGLPPATAAEAADRLFGIANRDPKFGEKGKRPPPFEIGQRTPADWPKNHEPGSLGIGDSVWYRDARFWITNAPPTWEHTSFVQICDTHIRPGGGVPKGALIFSVHADLLTPAPVNKSPAFKQPTKHAVESREKMKQQGVTDIGDDVAAMLRGKTLDEAYAAAADFLKVPEAELRAKYGRLNHGQQRMNLGNRMRALARKGVK